MVFIHHFFMAFAGKTLDFSLFQGYGPCGVTFFFILSGFVMTAGYGDNVLKPNLGYASFLKKRFVRIYPLHLLCLILALFAYMYANHLGGLPMSCGDMKIYLASVLLLQTWIPLRTVYYGCNDVAWFLADILFFYALFPMAVRVVYRLSGRRLLWVMIIVLAVYCLMLPCVPKQKVHWAIYICPPVRFLDFAWGIVLYRLFTTVEKNGRLMCKINAMSITAKTAIELFSLLSVVVVLQLQGMLSERWGYASVYWPVMFVLIFIFAVSGKYGGGIVSRFFENKLFYRLGALSFTFYMIHFVVIRVLKTFMQDKGIHWSLCLQLSLCLLIAWGGAYIISRFYEKPVTHYLKSKIKE